MTELLRAIVNRKRAEVDSRLGRRPVSAAPTTRSLRAALSRPGARFIMEVKRASPSGHRGLHSLNESMRAYAPVADAISVLTDGPGFGGSLADLAAARELFDGPILAKDFIVDPAQVSEARAAGADAVLAMMAVLGDDEARAVMAEAERLAMDVIVEVHDEAELGRALALKPAMVGINNRDFTSLATDLAVTERLAPLVPRDVLAIAESGITGRADTARLAPLADAFLVGTALMAAPDICQAARALVHGRVKICGLTNAADVALAASAGATHAGLIFVPGTPRALGPAQGDRLAAAARGHGLEPVGVFRDAAIESIAAAASADLSAVQLHGAEPAEQIAGLRGLLPQEVEIWAACPVNGSAAPARPGADRSLFDSGRGGTGEPFDWSLLAGRPDLPSAFLAGGIGPANARAAQAVGAYGLDVGSSVELAPGLKDPVRVAALFDALRLGSRGLPC
jgi:indole-3-glycerol phosphate synthase/phosphoribosylanthranilate isomerase